MLTNVARRVLDEAGRRYCGAVTRREEQRQRFRWVNERPVEYSFTFKSLGTVQPTTVLDVGTGLTALPSLLRTCGFVVTAIDNVHDYWPQGLFNRHWFVHDADITGPALDRRFDAVVCVSVIEHISDHLAAVRGMLRALRPGGYLVITCPYSEHRYVPNVYTQHGSYGRAEPYICQQFSRAEVDAWLGQGGVLIEQEYWQFFEGDTWSCGPLIRPPKLVGPHERHQHTCLLIRRTLREETAGAL